MFNLTTHGEEISRGVVIYDNFLEAPEEIITMGLEDPRWDDAQVINDDAEVTNLDYRSTRKLVLAPLVDYNPAWYYVAKGLKQMGYRYANEYKAYFQSMEYPQLLHYRDGEGYYKEHIDEGPGLNRAFSAVLYLNTVANGGETVFTGLDLAVKPVAGRLLMFPSNYLFIHEALTPVGSDKFAIVTWYRMDNG
jgi:hypothetical protein